MTTIDGASSMESGVERLVAEVADGRVVEVLTAGPADGLPLVFHSGTPSGLVIYPPLAEAAAAAGCRLVCYARPGYGVSDPLPGRVVADAASDVAAVLDQLGAKHFVTIGTSGGGPHALASAALLSTRCLAVATIAGVAPYNDVDWLTGMAPENVEEFGAACDGEAAITGFLSAAATELADVTGDQVSAALGQLVSRADRAVLTGEYADYLAALFRSAVSAGISGWRDDDLAFVRDWGFSLNALGTVPTSIWQGDQDLMVPLAHGQWLARHIPLARAHLLPGEGHLSILVTRFGEVLDELVTLAGWL